MKIGIHSPEQNDIGKYTRFTVAGAEFGLAKYPRAKPIALNGIEPATRIAISFAAVKNPKRTPPKASPTARSTSEITVANTTALAILARKYAGSGIGEARFTCSQP